MNSYWHIVTTRSRFEKRTNQLLNEQGFETFLPIHKVLSQWSDRKKWVEKPLFPGYLFVKYNQHNRFEALSTSGVARAIQFEHTDYIVSDCIIDGIKNELEENIEIVDIKTLDLSVGNEVTIMKGHFKGAQGKLVQINGKSKVVVEIKAIGQGVLLEINGTEIEQSKSI